MSATNEKGKRVKYTVNNFKMQMVEFSTKGRPEDVINLLEKIRREDPRPQRFYEVALTLGVMNRSYDLVKYVLESGVIKMSGDKAKLNQVLAYPIRNDDFEMLKLLVENGADVNGMVGKYIYPLHIAVKHDRFECLKYLVEKGANVNVRDSFDETPLHYAVWDRKYEITVFLIEKGADINAKNANGYTPLHVAAYVNDVNIAKLLVEKGSDLRAVEVNGGTPLDIAIQRRAHKVEAYLRSIGAPSAATMI